MVPGSTVWESGASVAQLPANRKAHPPMEPVRLDIWDIRLSPAQVDKGTMPGLDNPMFSLPPAARTTSQGTFKMSMALESNSTTQESPPGERILCVQNATCFPFNGQPVLQQADEVDGERKVFDSVTILLIDSKTQIESWAWWGMFHREKERKLWEITGRVSLEMGQALVFDFVCLFTFYLFWKFWMNFIS